MFEESMNEDDAVHLLRSEHRKIQKLVASVAGEEQAAMRRQIMQPLLRELEIHNHLERDFFYPYMRTRLQDDVIEKPLEFNLTIGHLAAKLKGLDPTDVDFVATMEELIRAIDLHVFEEEEYLFSQLETADPDTYNELIAMSERMKSQRAELEKNTGDRTTEDRTTEDRTTENRKRGDA